MPNLYMVENYKSVSHKPPTGFFKAVILCVVFNACWSSRIWSQGLDSNYESTCSILSGSTNLTLVAIRRPILSHACSMNDIHDIACTPLQQYIKCHYSAGSATGARSPDGGTTSAANTKIVEEGQPPRFH